MTQRQQTIPGTQDDRVRIKALDEAIAEWQQLEHDAARFKAKAALQQGHVEFLLRQNERTQYVFHEGGLQKRARIQGGKSKVVYDEVPEDTLRRKDNGKSLPPPSTKAQVPSDADKKRVTKPAAPKSIKGKPGKPFKLGEVAKQRALAKKNGKAEPSKSETPDPTGVKSDAT